MKQKVVKDRTVKKIKYLKKKNGSRNNLNAAIKKMIAEVYA